MPANVYRVLDPLQVEIKSNWADPWVVRPNVEALNGSAACEGVGQFQFRVRYGQLKHPGEAAYSYHPYTNIGRDWVRVKVSPYTDADIIFQGRIESDARQLHGPDAGGAPSGEQVFSAYDGTHLLQKRIISQSVIKGFGGVFETHDILMHFNKPNYGRTFEGNRDNTLRSTGGTDHYVFTQGGDEWRVIDAINYVVAEFIGGSGNPLIEPQWTITVPAGELEEVLEPFELPTSFSIADMIRTILGRRYGWTWCVLPNANGYEIKFSTLTATGATFQTASVPANPNVLTVSTSDPDANIELENTLVNSFGKVRVIGRPMVVCMTFDDRPVYGTFNDPNLETLTPNNSFTFTGGGAVSVEVLERVFQAPHFPQGLDGEYIPTIQDDGTLDTTTLGPLPFALNTLESLPLQIGHDYRYGAVPATINDAEFETPFVASSLKTDGVKFLLYKEKAGASLYTLPTRIGLKATDTDESGFTFDDYQHYMTVAFEAGQRIQCSFTMPGSVDSDGEMVIEVPEAELWWIAKNTLIGLDANDEAMMPFNGFELRNDKDKIYRAMAGAIARYVHGRSRARVSFKGLWTYQNNLGDILGTVSDATNANTIAAPITAVQWQFENDYSTTVTTGFAV